MERKRGQVSNVLAVVAAEGGLVASLSGLVDGLGLLGLEVDALVTLSGDGDSLVVDKTGVLLLR